MGVSSLLGVVFLSAALDAAGGVASLKALAVQCDGGDAEACVQASQRQDGGLDVEPDPKLARAFMERAARLLQRQCDRGDLAACTRLGGLYRNVVTLARHNDSRPRALFERACAAGHLAACADLGDVSWNAQSPALYSRACDGGVGHGCLKLAQVLTDWTGFKDPERARALREQGLQRLEAACMERDTRSCGELLSVLDYFTGKARAERLATGWLEPACDQGIARACTTLALATQDDAKLLVSRLEAACTLGDDGACRYASRLFAEGKRDVAKDEVQALRFTKAVCAMGWYRECEQLCPSGKGDPTACRTLAKRASERAARTRALTAADNVPLVRFGYADLEGVTASLWLLHGHVQGGGSGHAVFALESVSGPFAGIDLGTLGAGVGVGYGFAAGAFKGLRLGLPLAQASLRGSLVRTWDGAAYAGGDVGLGYFLVNARLGYAMRLGGSAQDGRVTWSVGLGF